MAATGRAHLVVGSTSVRTLTDTADCVVRAKVVSVQALAPRSTEEPALDRPSVDARIVEILKGACGTDRVRFVQHGHGVATFEPGREHLVFLVALARHRELGDVAVDGGVHWVSLQEHDDAHPLDGPDAATLVAATRDYVRAGAASSAPARDEALRAATLRLLASADPTLAASAVRDLVAEPTAPLITPRDEVALLAIVDDPDASMGIRVALLRAMEQRGMVDGGPRIAGWLADGVPTAERVIVLRAAGGDPSPEVRTRVRALLASEDVEVAAAAALALGRPGESAAVEPLTAALQNPSARVRNAAIRGLGRTRTAEAIEVLEATGEHHPDPSTRRLARAEAAKRTREGVAAP